MYIRFLPWPFAWKAKPWSRGLLFLLGAFQFWEVAWEQTRTNMSAKVCNWSWVVDFITTLKVVRKLWESCEKDVRMLWESCEKAVRKLWQGCGKFVRNLWESWTFSKLSQNLLSTFLHLVHNFITTFSHFFHKFFTTLSKLSQNFLTIFSQLSHNFLKTVGCGPRCFLPSKWDYLENRSFLSAQNFVKVV